MQTEVVSVKATRSYLVVRFRIKSQVVAHQHVCRVPWERIFLLQEEVLNAIEAEALKRLGENRGQYQLPLESWE